MTRNKDYVLKISSVLLRRQAAAKKSYDAPTKKRSFRRSPAVEYVLPDEFAGL